MSSIYVRNLVRQWAGAAFVTAQFHDTISLSQSPGDALWATAEFYGGQSERATYCTRRELGSFAMVFYMEPGNGDAMLAQAEADMAAFMQQTDVTGRLTLRNCSPPESRDDGTPWYGVQFIVDYTFNQ